VGASCNCPPPLPPADDHGARREQRRLCVLVFVSLRLRVRLLPPPTRGLPPLNHKRTGAARRSSGQTFLSFRKVGKINDDILSMYVILFFRFHDSEIHILIKRKKMAVAWWRSVWKEETSGSSVWHQVGLNQSHRHIRVVHAGS